MYAYSEEPRPIVIEFFPILYTETAAPLQPVDFCVGEWNFSPFNRIEDEMRDSASRQVDWDLRLQKTYYVLTWEI